MTSVPEEPFTAQQFGIANPLGNLFPGMPTLTVTGLFTFGSSPLADQSSRINSFGVRDTLSIVSGRHRIKVGGEYRRSQVNFYFNAFSRGQPRSLITRAAMKGARPAPSLQRLQ